MGLLRVGSLLSEGLLFLGGRYFRDIIEATILAGGLFSRKFTVGVVTVVPCEQSLLRSSYFSSYFSRKIEGDSARRVQQSVLQLLTAIAFSALIC